MGVEVICGDALQIMRKLINGKLRFDMIFIDPPYFDWQTGEKGDNAPNHMKLAFYTYKLLKPNCTVWLCGTISNLLEIWPIWSRYFKLNFELIWYKQIGTMAINPKKPLPTHENIWCLYRKEDKLIELKLNMRTKQGEIVEKIASTSSIIRGGNVKTWLKDAGYIKSVFVHKPIRKKSKEYWGHPTQKPLKLMTMIVECSTQQGDFVLDPFAGSGTTLLACQMLNRNCLGIEINPKYVDIINRRLRAWKSLRKFIQSI